MSNPVPAHVFYQGLPRTVVAFKEPPESSAFFVLAPLPGFATQDNPDATLCTALTPDDTLVLRATTDIESMSDTELEDAIYAAEKLTRVKDDRSGETAQASRAARAKTEVKKVDLANMLMGFGIEVPDGTK